jgi:geranylgeranyl diphosphate synthase, type II
VDIKEYFSRQAVIVDRWLDRLIPPTTESPELIHEAMRYSLFAGGKRLRPVLAIAAGEMFGADPNELLPIACALEMIHTYSLIHDDLPAMDNDDLRRGMPTSHIRFGEAIAILAGDALLTQAFITLAATPQRDSSTQVRLIAEVARAAGTTEALIGGQVLDLHYEGKPVTAPQLEAIHRAKTGALIRCAVRVGAITGGASDDELAALTIYAEKIGLAFQIADDLLDETATSEDLGKTAGKDAATQKATYTSLHGIIGARHLADEVIREAIAALEHSTAALDGVRRDSTRLREIAHFIVDRRS